MPRLGWCVAWLLLVLAAGGCADGVCVNEWQQQRPVYVLGRVKYRGYPVPGGQIVFAADPDYGAGTDLIAVDLGLDGGFIVQDAQQVGLKPGYYRITVSTHPSSRCQLPRRYLDPHASGLRCQIEPDQPLRLNIELD
jgi:hypothetical protein